MNVGIIIYSYTGHTLSVAEKLKEAIREKGHIVEIVEIEVVDPNAGKISLKTNPDITSYDYVIFASPVQAFMLARVMKKYISELPPLEGKKAACFVTRQLKKKCLGGTRAINWFIKKCGEKGIEIIDSAMVSWSSKTRDEDSIDLVNQLSNIII